MMARDARDLRRLAEELAALTPEEREKVIAYATRGGAQFLPPPIDFKPPLIQGGTWVGGDLRRESFYDHDGR
jgi:hypothetical protein